MAASSEIRTLLHSLLSQVLVLNTVGTRSAGL